MAFSATYNIGKADWWPITLTGQSITNYQRWVTAHTTYGDLSSAGSYFSKSFSFQLSSGVLTPTNDSSLRTSAASFGSGLTVTQGGDFLQLGNYVSPTASVLTINGVTVPNGLLYFAGQPAVNGGASGSITRDWIEVLSTSNLDTLIPLVDGNTYTIDITGL